MPPRTLTRPEFAKLKPKGKYAGYLKFIAAHRTPNPVGHPPPVTAKPVAPKPAAPRATIRPTPKAPVAAAPKAPTVDPYAPLTEDQIASRAASDVYDPYNQIINSTVTTLVGQAAQQAQARRDASSKLMAALQPYAAQIRGEYDTAARGVQGVTGAVAGGLTSQGQQLSGELGGKLAQIQAPGQAVTQFAGGAAQTGVGAAGAVGALGSAESEKLHGVGAANADWAAKLPGLEQLQALHDLGLIQGDLSTALLKQTGDLQIEAEKAYMAAVKDYRDAEVQKANARSTQEYHAAVLKQNAAKQKAYVAHQAKQDALASRKQGFSEQATIARINQGQARIDQGATRLGMTASQNAQRNAQAWARVNISDHNAQLSAERNQLAWEKFKANPHGTGKGGGYTKAQVTKLAATAGKVAKDSFAGYWALPDLNGDPGDEPLTSAQLIQLMREHDVATPLELAQDGIVGKAHRSYQEAMSLLLNQGVPLAMAQSALNRYWTKPGVATPYDVVPGHPNQFQGRPKQPFQERNPKASAGPSVGRVPGELQLPTLWRGTHPTDNLGWGTKTAEDIMARPGTPVGAPEDGVIERHGSAQGGQSLYFRSNSGYEYSIGHIESNVPAGTRVRRGQVIAAVSADHPRPHVHIDRRRLF